MSQTTVSPLAPDTIAALPALDGVRLSTAAAGIKYAGRPDVMMMVFDATADVAGVFTRSLCPSAPVDHCRHALAAGRARALVVNSGNANAFTGRLGAEATARTADATAAALGCGDNEVFLASTGVIGEPLDAAPIVDALPTLVASANGEGWLDAARAIMTTDTYPKVATRIARIDDVDVTLNGMAKGAGMIAPDMATMLAFVATDADIDAKVLQALLVEATEPTFNAITVDSDTSTSDTLLMFATGTAGARGQARLESADDRRLADFRRALADLMKDLALQVVSDGEGARKLVEITVTGASSPNAAKRIARSIADSPLVKTAIAGEDANWGRVVMAVGKAGERAERDRLAIWFADVRVAVDGMRDPDYSEEAAAAVMREPKIPVRVDLGIGQGQATVWTCDLTREYVAINGDYRS
ncbi:bifunctional glutamate N-acetyltransferase/amino-acid acetyltransferase ArgJ [Pararhizobium mangrovi]|uniref:Arginine biosynthesis bifunctional protein ArgJ n=1 Tax=Pararhizobium mangrovi TaxID=2590452 RepID=A0A506U2F6_9HYPH|nr:bifunctional glutamate N-acetyltransferase/amino-acid acetyltransferase ArgJ [Pararhizobium mangrovi]TPW26057.1 bifunctional glutamate N-acetyltransferase/amino-acid acetyltransferase ArgJ [Pararhizobium mangrovi]